MKKIFVVLLALLLIVPFVSAGTCPTYWNDPNLSCITTANWHDFVNNWTYQNSSIWTNFNSYATSSSVNSMNASIWYTLNNVSSGSTDLSGVFFQNGTRIMTGSLNAGGFNISNISSPIISTNAATKGYVDIQDTGDLSNVSIWINQNNTATLSTSDSHISTNISMVSLWVSQNNSATLSTTDSHIASNISTTDSWVSQNKSAILSTTGSWISQNSSATLSQADAHITSNLSTVSSWISQNNTVSLNTAITASTSNMSISGNTSFPVSSTNGDLVSFYGTGGHTVVDSGISNSTVFLTTGSRVMSGTLDVGGNKVSNASDPVSSGDLVTLNYFNAHPGSGRTRLLTPTIYYVTTTGSDTTGDGSNSTPWATLQHACDYVSANVDPNSYTVTIKLASGTYSDGTIISTSWISGFGLFIYGDDATPSNVKMPNIAVASGVTLPSVLGINGITFTDSSYAIYHDGTGTINAHNVVASGGGTYSSFNRAAILRVNNITQPYGGIS